IDQVDLDAGQGDDTFILNKLTQTSSVKRVNLNESELRSVDAQNSIDGQGRDTISFNGSDQADTFELRAIPASGVKRDPPNAPFPAAQEKVTGLGFEVYVPNFNDHIMVNGGGGKDTISTDIDPQVSSTAPRGPRGQFTFNGGADNDTINVLAAFGPTFVNGDDRDDIVNVGSRNPKSGGSLNSVLALVTVNGGTGSDTFNADDSGDTTANTGQLSATALTGLGMAAGVAYAGVEAVTIALGSGKDIFTVAS